MGANNRRSECEAVVRRLWPYVDDQLPESERERVTRHLEECAGCRSHFDFAESFLDAVQRARPENKEDNALRARVLAALSDEGSSH